jgi:hypothetical protein
MAEAPDARGLHPGCTPRWASRRAGTVVICRAGLERLRDVLGELRINYAL